MRQARLCGDPACTAAVRITLEDRHLLPDLRDALAARIDTIVAETGEGDLEVSILGSLREPFARAELERRLHAWRLRHPGARIQISD